MALQDPRFPQFLDPALRQGPLPELIRLELETPRSDRPADLARAAALFWERDLKPWERRAALAIAAFGGASLAGDFICCGWRQFGHFSDLAPMREAQRLANLTSYLNTAHRRLIHLSSASAEKPLSAPKKALLGMGSLACVALSACPTDPARARLLSLGIASGILALPFVGPFLWSLSGAPMGVCLATAPVFLGASLWAAHGVGQSFDGTSYGQARISAAPLLIQARISGALGRLKRAQAPGPARLSLLALSRLDESFEFERLAPAARAQITAEEFELSKNPKAFAQTQARAEAIELEAQLRPAPAPNSGAFARLARSLARALRGASAPEPHAAEPAGAERKKSGPRL